MLIVVEEQKVAKWWGRETTGSDEAAPAASHGIGEHRTDLYGVGFVFLRRVMLMEMKVVR